MVKKCVRHRFGRFVGVKYFWCTDRNWQDKTQIKTFLKE